MTAAPDASALERSIYQRLASMPSSDVVGRGRVSIKVALDAPAHEGAAATGALHLSMPRLDADPEWLSTLMAYARAGFERDEIETGDFRVTLHADEPFESFRDPDLGAVILDLPAGLRVEPRALTAG